ncbi:hypothetical protein AEV23_00004 [Klebsiella phage VB_KpM-AEV23]|nr:hypothetical protein AEV23_00004 [Klebsiella phage VB_KpM-AEV23]
MKLSNRGYMAIACVIYCGLVCGITAYFMVN